MSSPEIAVVIPTRDRETRLAFALDALAEQTLDRERFEVVVVRDGASEDRFRVATGGLNVRHLVNDGPRGPAATRNVGWRSSSAPLVAFTDDDCRPRPDWLETLADAWEEEGRPPMSLLQGRTEPDPDERPLLTGLARSQLVAGPSPWHPTCNLAYPRELLERLGGFDERFDRPEGEDTDLGLRAVRAGARPTFVEEAVVWHAVHSRSLPGALRDSIRGRGMAMLFARHPDHRRHIFLRLFWKRSHATALLAGFGCVACLAGRRAGALAAVPYALDGVDLTTPRRPRPLLAMAVHLPTRLTVDLVELFATARGALRERTLLL